MKNAPEDEEIVEMDCVGNGFLPPLPEPTR